MQEMRAAAVAHPNLALIKYWGKADEQLNIPTNGSISVVLDSLTTRTTVAFDPALGADQVQLNGVDADPVTRDRVVSHLDLVRERAGVGAPARVESHNDFPAGTGLASSASAYAALSLAATRAVGLDLDATALSALTRRGSGSASRSIHGGFVEWVVGTDDATSVAHQLAPPDHWDLVITTVILEQMHKAISSTEGHAAALTSPLFGARLAEVSRSLDAVRRAVLERDIEALVVEMEHDALSMHAIAMTSRPPGQKLQSGIFYWLPCTLDLIRAVQDWRREGLAVGVTIDAGANVHLICEARDQPRLELALADRLCSGEARWVHNRPGQGACII